MTLGTQPNETGTAFTSFGSIALAPGSTVNVSDTQGMAIRGGRFVLTLNEAALSSGTGAAQPETISLGPKSSIVSSNAGVAAGADVRIQTGHFHIEDASVQATTTGSGQSGTITISASESASLTNSIIDTRSTPPTNSLVPNGNAGAVTITAPTISVDGGLIATSAIGDGIGHTTANSGAVTLAGTTSISLHRSDIITETFNTKGNSGAVGITAPTVSIRGVGTQGIITSQHGVSGDLTAGHGGDVTIAGTTVTITEAGHLESVADSVGTFSRGGHLRISGSQHILLGDGTSFLTSTTSQGDAGNIDLQSPHVTITGGSTHASDTFGLGNGGTITITAPEHLALESSSTLFTTANLSSQGAAGRIEVKTPSLAITGGSAARSESHGAGPGGIVRVHGMNGSAQSIQITGLDSGIFTNATGSGSAGNIELRADAVALQQGGTLSAATSGTAPSAIGGSITIRATNQVTLTNGASVTASSTGPTAGNAGNISLDAGQQLDMTNGSSITTATESPQANGGNIDIRAIDRIQVVDSTISTSVLGAEGNGGNIFIDPKVVVLQGSDVTAKAVGGSGGNITFVTPLFLADSTSLVSASSERGPSGTVTIQSPTSNLSGAVGQLVSKIAPAQVLIQNRCVAATPGTQSTFILAGRDTLPLEPGGWQSSPVAMGHWTKEDTEEHASGLMVRNARPNPLPALISKDQSQVLSLRRLTPPGFLVQTFATPSTDCPS